MHLWYYYTVLAIIPNLLLKSFAQLSMGLQYSIFKFNIYIFNILFLHKNKISLKMAPICFSSINHSPPPLLNYRNRIYPRHSQV
jgi:hypothetical protein